MKRSLGTIESPSISLEGFSTSTSVATIKLETATKVIRIKVCIYGVRKIVDIAREIVGRQRAHALAEWSLFNNLKEYTGYKEPEEQK